MLTQLFAQEMHFFHLKKIIHVREYQQIKGDTATRIIVAGYSNKNRIEKGKWEDVLYNKENFVYMKVVGPAQWI